MRRILFGLLLTLLPVLGWAQARITYTPPVVYPWMSCTSAACTSTVPILLPDGTAGAPVLARSGGATNGLYFDASGQLTLTYAGTARLFLGSAYIYPNASDAFTLGDTSKLYSNLFLTRSIQGSKSKALTDNTATAFVRLTVADDDYEGCHVIYTAYAEDADTDARQTRTGGVYFAILNTSGTETCAASTGDSAVLVTAGTLACTFDCNSASAATIDLRATCDTSLDAAAETLTFEYRLDCPSTLTVTPQ